MVRSKRLKPIKKLAQNNEKAAAKALGESLDNHKQELQKLNQLEQYRIEYLTEMEEKVKAGVSGAALQHYHQFLNKLNLAITQQKDVIQKSTEQVDINQDQWKSKHSRTKAISQVMTKIKDKEVKQKEKKESAQIDEMSTQAFIRRQNSNGLG
ncbi:flagellar export protein FliJ [Aliikangiella coralliicola]|uniref:Flagellar FliJ protein n=1 Tax=Aliikangiella coralliicola TaxID=2592383 RepID=A0A545UB73_9GAMM|nr:flagellar export protein FliJ [Aliikangiella coralliicola]TQV86720.1 flagellar export protein FliJ [Aliikangiella coralliicola]